MKAMKVLLLICGAGMFTICLNVMGQKQSQTQATTQEEWKGVQTSEGSAVTGQKYQSQIAQRTNITVDQTINVLDKFLKLTPVQKKNVKTIMKKHKPSLNKIHEQIIQIQEQLRKLVKRASEEIKPQLTTKQKYKLEEQEDKIETLEVFVGHEDPYAYGSKGSGGSSGSIGGPGEPDVKEK